MSRATFRFPALQAHDPDSLGGFRLLARLGEGGMGQVFLAFSPGGQPAAVKIVRNEFARDTEFGRRFAREVGAAQRVRGAHIAPLLDAAPQAERPWLATTYVAGPSLRDLVIDHGPLPAAQVMLLAWGIAHALTDIHAAKVVHRDLKPGNIMLDESGPKVIDFGIVKSLTQSVTSSSHSTRIGTPLYMSPEQAAGRTVDAASDVFALGSTLYFVATGREAFAAENEWAVAHRIVADTPDVSALAPPLHRLITACLDKDPARRPTPALVREWCEEELGDAFGPGVWMGITGARAAIRQRTHALRALTLPDSEAAGTDSRSRPDSTRGAAEDDGGATPAASTASPDLPGTRATPEQASKRTGPASVGGVIATHVAEILLAAVALAWASSLPIMSESWKAVSSGSQVAHVTLLFDLHHLWEPVPSGIPGVDTDWPVASVGFVGTAAALVCAVLSLLGLAGNRKVRVWGTTAFLLVFLWIIVAGVAALFPLAMTFGVEISDDNPAYKVRSVLMDGGWLLLLANGLMVDAVCRTLRRID